MVDFSFKNFEKNLETHLKVLCAEVPSPLKESIHYSVFSGGKRIRPKILFKVGEALGVDLKTIFHLAASLELVHTYTLIHDDLPCMDNDDERRGKPTNHIVYGEDTALLAGDALQSLAVDSLLILKNEVNALALLNAIEILSSAMGGKKVIAGQVSEKHLYENPSLEKLLSVFNLKTSSLFIPCFTLPALFSSLELSPFERNLMNFFGEQIGVSFQIADDLEDEKCLPWETQKTHIRAYLSDRQSIERIQFSIKTIENEIRLHTNETQMNETLKKITSISIEIIEDILKKCEYMQ